MPGDGGGAAGNILRCCAMKRALAGFLLAVLFAPAAARAAEGAYDLFPTAMTGTARSVALGGATIAADPDGYEAVFANPAGLSGMAGTGIDFGSDGNGVDNFVVDLNQPKSRSLNVPIKYSYAGVRYVTGSGWGVGFAASTPFDYEDTFNGTTRVVRRRSTFVATNDLNDVHTRADAYTLAAGRGFLDGQFLSALVAFEDDVHRRGRESELQSSKFKVQSSKFQKRFTG